MNTSGKNFRYVQFETEGGGRGYACVCFDWQRDANKIAYKAGVSFCSPKDIFSKQLARLKAENRYNGSTRVKSVGKHVESVVNVPEPKTKFVSNEEFKEIFTDLLGQVTEVPKWLRDSVSTGSFRFGLTQAEAETSDVVEGV